MLTHMRRATAYFYLIALSLSGLISCSHSVRSSPKSWNPQSAANYLDLREEWWTQWPQVIRDHGTFCISCHTAMPYTLARPAIRKVLGVETPTANEIKLLENVRTRVRLHNQIGPYYTDLSDGNYKTAEAQGTEAVLNALILSSHDAENGQLSDDARLAFENMWNLQLKSGDKKGSWSWLQFNLEPTEASDSAYYGATLAAVAVGMAPENYRSDPEIQANLLRLREYLNREYANQTMINRVGLLWASARLPGLTGQDRQQEIIKQIFSRQLPDGGWSLSKLSGAWEGWSFYSLQQRLQRILGNAIGAKSDAYATGLITYCLLRAGIPRENAQLHKALAWLENNQDDADGRWAAYALNKTPKPNSISDHFRSDAATAFAVLALTEKDNPESNRASIR
jgi:squalene-hopene/tetraprenyl-beta-curcumene cyclase